MNSRSSYYRATAFSLLVSFFCVSNVNSIDSEDLFQMLNDARNIARTGNYLKALDKFDLVIEQANENNLLLAIAHSNVADIQRIQGNTLEALNQYYRALRAYDEIGNQNGISIIKRRIAEIAPTAKRKEEEAEQSDLTSPDKSHNNRKKLIREAIERIRGKVTEQKTSKDNNRGTDFPESKPSPAVDGRKAAYDGYLEKVRKVIIGAWKYPKQSSLSKEKGKVDVEFTILKDGRLQDVHIAQSSGYSSLDQEALRAVKSASPFIPIPNKVGLNKISVHFSFNYSLSKKRKSHRP